MLTQTMHLRPDHSVPSWQITGNEGTMRWGMVLAGRYKGAPWYCNVLMNGGPVSRLSSFHFTQLNCETPLSSNVLTRHFHWYKARTRSSSMTRTSPVDSRSSPVLVPTQVNFIYIPLILRHSTQEKENLSQKEPFLTGGKKRRGTPTSRMDRHAIAAVCTE